MDFHKEVLEASKNKLVVVDFYADWCKPCKILSPLLELLEKEYKYKLVKVNTEIEQDIAQEFGIMSIPTVILFKNKEPIDMFVGAYPEPALREIFEKHTKK